MLPRIIQSIAFAATASLAASACDSRATDVPTDAVMQQLAGERTGDQRGLRQYGMPVRVGNGRARSYVVRRLRDGRTVEVGIALDQQALDGLPAKSGHGAGGEGHAHPDAYEYRLPLPRRDGSGVKHITLDWNPGGHEPPGIYDVAHFDFHFYTISQSERDAIVPTDPQFMAKAGNFPVEAQRPAGFMVLPPAPAPAPAVPMMGVHWSNLAAPELQPPGSPNHAPFSHTFIYGSWDGRFIFAEPMITRAFLLTQPDIDVPVAPLPQSAGTGLTPTSYRILWDARAREYRIALAGLAGR